MSDRYEIQEKIGQGGIGAVYQAYDTQLKRAVAIKRMLPTEGSVNGQEASEVMLKEATTLSALQHPNIVTVYDVGVDEEGPFVVMELLKGETLDQVIKRGVLTLKDFSEVVTQTMEALIAAEASGVLHRDLKPSNVMVNWLPSKKFHVKILDFSLAKFSKKPSPQTIDQGDAIFGSIYFMAPEQFERGDLDQRTDLYSMGCLYYYCLAGQYPFQGESAAQVMASHLQGAVTSIEKIRSDLPPTVCQWVMWLINREAANRPASAKEAFENFNQITAGIDPVTGPVPLAKVPPAPAVGQTTSRRLIVPPPQKTGSVVARATASRPQVAEGKAATASRPGPLQGGTAAVRVMPRKGGGLMTYLGIALGVMVLVVLALGARIWLQQQTSERQVRRFEILAEQQPPIGTSHDVQEVLVPYLDGISTNAMLAEMILRRLRPQPGARGTIDLAVLEALRGSRDPRVQERLISVIRFRQITSAEEDLLGLAAREVDPRVTGAAMKALGAMGDEGTLERMLALLSEGAVADLPPGMDEALRAIVSRLEEREKATDALIDLVESVPDSLRRPLIRVLASLGGQKVLTLFQAWLEEKEGREEAEGDRLAILLALMLWPERSPGAVALAGELMRRSGPDQIWGLEFWLHLSMTEGPEGPSQRSMIETLWTALRTRQDDGEWNKVRVDLVFALPQLEDGDFAKTVAEEMAASELLDAVVRDKATEAMAEIEKREREAVSQSG